jgi:hypothetical protein
MSDSIADPNRALNHYLNRYCASEASPGYAVLLRGPWGSGKTWFIEKFQERLSNANKRSLYVSLFGCRSPADITDQFFVQIHPRLGNKHVQKGWSVIKGMFKLGLKVDLDRDGKDDDSLQVDIKDLGMWASTQGAILIFDDLERVSMPIEEVLGFINQFVEHDGYRVLLLANESAELCQSPSYLKIKEKVIGRTFEVQPNIEAAFETFVAELTDKQARDVIQTRRSLVLDVMHRAAYRNLRQLRQAIFDFADLLNCLGHQPTKEKTAFVNRLLEDAVTLSIEYRAGTITEKDIREIGNTNWNRYFTKDRNGNDEKSTLSIAEQALARHDIDEFSTLALLPESYAQFFSTGYLLPKSASDALENSPYLTSANTASWRRLWYLRSLSDDELSSLAEDVHAKLVNLEYRDEGELLHVAALMIFLSSNGLIGRSQKQVDATLARVIRKMRATEILPPGSRGQTQSDNLKDMSAYGLGFFDKSSERFKRFVTLYCENQCAVRSELLRRRSQDWLLLLDTDTAKWAGHLLHGEGEKGWFSGEAVLNFVSPYKFARVLTKLQTPDLDHIRMAFSGRFESIHHADRWKLEELPFLRGVVAHLEKARKVKGKRTHTFSAHFLRSSIVPTLNNAVIRLEEFRINQAT